jgi:tetratricopeptide (TPR) repeat protein
MPKQKSESTDEQLPGSRSKRYLVYTTVVVAVATWLWFGGGAAGFALMQARSALSSRDLDASLEWIEIVDWLDIRNAEAALLKARISRRKGELGDARDWLQKALDRGCPQKDVRREQTLAFAQAGQMREAEPQLRALLLDPGDDAQEICEAFASGYYLNHELKKAAALIDSWAADFPEDPQPWLFRGRIQKSQQEPKLAESAFREALKRDPNFVDAWPELGEVLIEQLRPEEALAAFQRCLELAPDHDNARVGIAAAYVVLGKPEKALPELNRVLENRPHLQTALLQRGKLHMEAARYDDAVKDFRTLCQVAQGVPGHRYQLAMALRSAGHVDEARGHFEFAEKGRTALRAVDMVTLRVSENPEDLKARFELGTTLLEYGDPTQGVAWLRSILEYAPEHREALKALTLYYEDRAKTEPGFTEVAKHFRSEYDLASARTQDKNATPETD